MSIEENSSLIKCQGETLVTAAIKEAEINLSPTRSSSRIRKLKLSVDSYCNTDKAFETSNSFKKDNQLLPGDIEKSGNIATANQETNRENVKGKGLRSYSGSFENNCAFFQTNIENESFKPMFDDIFEQKYINTMQSSLPIQSDSLKEEKCYSTVEASKINCSNIYLPNKNNVPTEDVSKVFKIISKPDIFADKLSDFNSSSRPLLKTYSNKRKNFQNFTILESFGLPDYPIVAEDILKPIANEKLDAEILDKAITILDLQHVNEPWVITNMEEESLFPIYEDIRMKAEPDNITINGSFLDIVDADNVDADEFNFFTSTPLNKIVNKSTNICLTSVNSRKSKEIDIETIKINFKNMLNNKDTKIELILENSTSRKEKNIKKSKTINHKMSFIKNSNNLLESLSNKSREKEKVSVNHLSISNKILNITSKNSKGVKRIKKKIKCSKCVNKTIKKINMPKKILIEPELVTAHSNYMNVTTPVSNEEHVTLCNRESNDAVINTNNPFLTENIDNHLTDLKQTFDIYWNIQPSQNDNSCDVNEVKNQQFHDEKLNHNFADADNNKFKEICAHGREILDMSTNTREDFKEQASESNQMIFNHENLRQLFSHNTITTNKRALRSSNFTSDLTSIEDNMINTECSQTRRYIHKKVIKPMTTKHNEELGIYPSNVVGSDLITNDREEITNDLKMSIETIKGTSGESETKENPLNCYKSVYKNRKLVRKYRRLPSELKVVITPLDLSSDIASDTLNDTVNIGNKISTKNNLKPMKSVMCRTKLPHITDSHKLCAKNNGEDIVKNLYPKDIFADTNVPDTECSSFPLPRKANRIPNNDNEINVLNVDLRKKNYEVTNALETNLAFKLKYLNSEKKFGNIPEIEYRNLTIENSENQCKSSENVEFERTVDLQLFKTDHTNNGCMKPESIESGNFTQSSNSDYRELRTHCLDVPYKHFVVKERKDESDLVKNDTLEENSLLSNDDTKNPELQIVRKLENTFSISKSVIQTLEHMATDKICSQNAVNGITSDTSPLTQNEFDTKSQTLNIMPVSNVNINHSVNKNYESVILKKTKSSINCNIPKVYTSTGIITTDMHGNKPNKNVLTNSISDNLQIRAKGPNGKNTEIACHKIIEDTPHYSKGVKKSTKSRLRESLARSPRRNVPCRKKTIKEHPIRSLTNINGRNMISVTSDGIKNKISKKGSSILQNRDNSKNLINPNILTEKQNVKNSKHRRLDRRLVEHVNLSSEENYRNRLRNKTIVPCHNNDLRRKKLNNIYVCKCSCHLTTKKAKTCRCSLNRCKRFVNKLCSNVKVSRARQNEDAFINKKRSADVETLRAETVIGEHKDFHVGDLAWGQIGCHPFWPCLITGEPETGCYKRIGGGKVQRLLYHVRFFGDKGRRAWINRNQIISYCSKHDLQILMDKLKHQKKTSMHRFFYIRSAYLEKWQCAVKEADCLKSKNVQDRLAFFYKVFKPKLPSKQNLKLPSPKTHLKQKSLKRKAKEKVTDLEENQTLRNISSSHARKRLKRELSEDKNVLRGNFSKTALSQKMPKPDVVQLEDHYVDDHTSSNNASCLSLDVKHESDEIYKIRTKTDSEKSTNVLVYTMEAQKALFKRNNLFKRVSRDKVCQYCLKSENVLKCRGRCNGSYHIDCSTKILEEITLTKRRDKNRNKTNTSEENHGPSLCGNVNNTERCRKPYLERKLKHFNHKYNLRYMHANECSATQDVLTREIVNANKIELELKENYDRCGLEKDEDHVQIITVTSSVYNTPPKRTFPPDFKNMSLAEQIDYKMKEIMKKFEFKTSYAESSSDSNSSIESFLNQSSSTICPSKEETFFQIDGGSNTQLDLIPNRKDEMQEECGLEPTKSFNIDSFNNITAIIETPDVNNDTENENNSNVLSQKSFVRHVTADYDSKSIDDTKEKRQMCTQVESKADPGPKYFKCGFCISNLDPFCFICNQSISKRGSSIRQKCSLYQCGRFYHPHCLKLWPQTQWSLIHKTKHKDLDQAVDSFVCPLHVCHTCVSDDPRAATSRCSGDKVVKCLRCPSTYHSTNFCVPAGSTILSSTQIICPRHRDKNKMVTINTTWCFICSKGGNLICCETCPTSVHPECLPVNLTDDDKFICEDCESGRLPLYDEIVWVKLGKFRWWPALILFPNEVPVNVSNIKHTTGEFVVKFFGTYDYYWVNRGRSFLFQEGDTSQCNSVRKKVDAAFNRAVEEAVAAHKLKKEFKLSQEAESIVTLKPPPYIRIKVNKPVGNVRQLDLDVSSTTACDCNPKHPYPCGPDSDCLNRLLLTECSPDICPAGDRCRNQSFEKREYPPLLPYKTQGRGWGLKTLAPIKKGQFVIEYVGELIDIEEYQRRIHKMHEQKEENYYFLTIDKDRTLDAGPKGNAARFMNHCCQPNCETQKWTVNGDTRVGLFATEDISADTELTFNYNLECVGKEKKVCRCGASNCSGFIGVKAKQDTDKKPKKPSYRKKKSPERIILPPCFVCGRKGNVGICNNKMCNKTYHLNCLQMTEWPEGNKFVCPWHNCDICSKRTIRCCIRCVSSFCPTHSEGNIRYDKLLGFICSSHDFTKSSTSKDHLKLKKIRDGTAVASRKLGDTENEHDVPLLLRYPKYSKFDLEIENKCGVNKSNICILQKPVHRHSSDYSSRDEGSFPCNTD